jgi:hypothetical protein
MNSTESTEKNRHEESQKDETCWEYVLSYSIAKIEKNKNSEINQICKDYINKKREFEEYLRQKNIQRKNG